jgi:hypothetical protein
VGQVFCGGFKSVCGFRLWAERMVEAVASKKSSFI